MIRTALTAISVCLFSIWPAPWSMGRDIFVDNVAGDDTRDGSSPEVTGKTGGPCRSIGRALKLVQPRDRVIVAKTDQPYRESFTIQAAKLSGSSQQPFEIIGNGAVLDGTQPVSKNGWEHVQDDVYRFQPPLTSFQVLFLGARPAIRKPTAPGGTRPTLEPLEWCLYDRHVYFRAAENKSPLDYELSYAHLTTGITLYEARYVTIRDLIVQGFQLDGVNAHDNVFDGTLQGLTCRGNGRSGISIGGACRITLEDCLVGDNGTAQVRAEGHCKAELIRCELLENTAPGLVKEGGEVVVRPE
jgi:hypothetical protein